MRRFASPFLATTLLAASAFAQVGATDHISVSEQPFQPATPQGSGIPVAAMPVAQPAVPAAASSVGAAGLSKVFDEADTNRDNVVTREEFLAKAAHHFNIADGNHDNRITREEMQAQQNLMLQNMFKSSGNWQQKIQGFMGGAAPAAPASSGIQAPVAPVVPKPVAPTY